MKKISVPVLLILMVFLSIGCTTPNGVDFGLMGTWTMTSTTEEFLDSDIFESVTLTFYADDTFVWTISLTEAAGGGTEKIKGTMFGDSWNRNFTMMVDEVMAEELEGLYSYEIFFLTLNMTKKDGTKTVLTKQ